MTTVQSTQPRPVAPAGAANTPPLPPPPAQPAQPPKPLQLRTPDELKAGMTVAVKGAGADDLAVARLIQDGAAFIAGAGGTTIGLTDVTINDRDADARNALGIATFYGNKGWFGLSTRSTAGVMEGIKRLRDKPFEQWTETQRQDFIQGNETILHEAGHVTLPAYDSANINAWRSASRDYEEGLTEVVTMTRIAEFMNHEYGVKVPELSDRISQSTSAYTRFSERIQRMVAMGTDGTPAQVAAAASKVADGVRADQRFKTIAEGVASNLGGPTAPPAVATEISKTLEGFVQEKSGTRTRLMQLQAALVDHKAGTPIDMQLLRTKLRPLDPSIAPPARVGDLPIE